MCQGPLKLKLSGLHRAWHLAPSSHPPGALLSLRMVLCVKTMWNQVTVSHTVLPRGPCTVPAISPKQLELTAFAISPSTFATFVWEKLNEGKFHWFNGREMKQLMRWNFLAALERNPKTPIRCALWTPLRETVVPAGLPLFSACIILEDVTAVPRGLRPGLTVRPQKWESGEGRRPTRGPRIDTFPYCQPLHSSTLGRPIVLSLFRGTHPNCHCHYEYLPGSLSQAQSI